MNLFSLFASNDAGNKGCQFRLLIFSQEKVPNLVLEIIIFKIIEPI